MNFKKMIMSSAIACMTFTSLGVSLVSAQEGTTTTTKDGIKVTTKEIIGEKSKKPFPRFRSETLQELYENTQDYFKYYASGIKDKTYVKVILENGDVYTFDLRRDLEEDRKNIKVRDIDKSYIVGYTADPNMPYYHNGVRKN